jgi:4-methyl-5(b-hydroxyethyl)-thiazole monophosphate biosynthesis
MEDGLTGAESTTSSVTVDGNIITSRGLGTALDFALTLIEEFNGKEAADKLAAAVVYM